jgi:hypothetical protein
MPTAVTLQSHLTMLGGLRHTQQKYHGLNVLRGLDASRKPTGWLLSAGQMGVVKIFVLAGEKVYHIRMGRRTPRQSPRWGDSHSACRFL